MMVRPSILGEFDEKRPRRDIPAWLTAEFYPYR